MDPFVIYYLIQAAHNNTNSICHGLCSIDEIDKVIEATALSDSDDTVLSPEAWFR